jgi:hypothetical protein
MVFATALTGNVALSAASPVMAASADRWQWLDNTYWYVPNDNILALISNPSLKSPIPVSDQTVYHITGYDGGYFWGTTAVSYSPLRGSSAPEVSCLQLVGSVTPEGKVHLTFTLLPSDSTDKGSSPAPTVGIGTMTPQRAGWTMENQMSTTAGNDILLTHWAYMYQCRPRETCFFHLPGVAVSIPEFLGSCASAETGG